MSIYNHLCAFLKTSNAAQSVKLISLGHFLEESSNRGGGAAMLRPTMIADFVYCGGSRISQANGCLARGLFSVIPPEYPPR